MELTEKGYKKRLIDDKIEDYLKIFGAIEIKLGSNEIEDAKKSLNQFSDEVRIKSKFKCIICGLWDAVVKDPETGIYIIPITALKN